MISIALLANNGKFIRSFILFRNVFSIHRSFLLYTAEINDLLKFKQNFKSVCNSLLCK